MKSRLRHRLYPTLPPSPLDPWINFGLSILASSGAAAVALTLSIRFGTYAIATWICVFGLVFLPHVCRRFRIVHGSDEMERMQVYSLLLIPGIALFILMPTWTISSALLVGLVGLHGYVLRFARPGSAAVMATLLPVVEVLLALDAIWVEGRGARVLGTAWMMMVLLGAAVVVTWLHARSTRRSLPPRHFSHQQPAESEAGLWDRARLVVGIGVLLLPVGLLLQQTALFLTPSGKAYAGLRDPADPVVEQDPLAQTPPSERPESDRWEPEPEQEAEDPVKKGRTFPEDVRWFGSLTQAGEGVDEVIAEIHCSNDVETEDGYLTTYGTANPLYLLATTLDTLSTEGLSRSLQSESIYYDDTGLGAEGWAVFDPDFPRGIATEYRIRLRNMPLRRGDTILRESPLLHDRRLVAMQHPRVRLAGDGTTLTEARDSVLSYRWLSVPVSSDLPLGRTALAEARYGAIPTDDPRFTRWAEEARALCADLEDPEAKLQRIVSHFRRDFYYDPRPSAANGIEAFADFFATRSGYCTYFASAAVLYLRANAIPARIATGFLVTEFDPERGAYHARLSDAHAWVEVQQADGSWRTIEPTPTSRRRQALDAMVAGLDYETLPPVEVQEAEPVAAVASEGPTHVMPEPRNLLEKGGPLLMGLLMVVTLVMGIGATFLALSRMIASFLGGKRHAEHFQALPEEARRSLAYWIRIEELLAQLGFHRRRSQTGAEFAHHVLRWGGKEFVQLPQVARLVYRTRFGGHAWREAEAGFLDQFEERLERQVRES